MPTGQMNATHWGLVEARTRDGRLTRLDPFHRDQAPSPLMHGTLDAVYAPNRVTSPAIRRGWLAGDRVRRGDDTFVEVGWNEAYDHVESALRATIRDKGNAGIFAGSYGWGSAGRFHHAATHLKRFLALIGGFVDQKQTYSFAAGQIICPHIVGTNEILFGGVSTTWPAILDNARALLFFGGINLSNAQIAAGGLGNHANIGWLREAGRRKLEIWSIGPVRETVAELPNLRWLPIRPGSDTALMLALTHAVIAGGAADHDFLDRCTVGFEPFRRYVLGETDGIAKTPAWASALTGIPETVIHELAATLMTQPSFLTASWSLQRQEHGEQPLWALIALGAVLGNIGLPGQGVCFGYGSTGNRGEPRPHVSSPGFKAGPNPLGRFIPVSRAADMLLEPGKTIRFNGLDLTYPDIDLVWWAGGNPFHHHQDLNRLVEAFRRPRTIIVNEIWWTSTARHADIVLPACTSFERNDLSGSPTDRFIGAMRQQIQPQGLSRSEFDIFQPLAERFGVLEAYAEGKDELGWIREIYQEFRARAQSVVPDLPSFEEFWERGYAELPRAPLHYTLFEAFRRDPDIHPLKTPSGRIELWSGWIADAGHEDVAPHPRWIAPREWLGAAEPDMLHLVSPQPATRLHGQLDGVGVSRSGKIDGREPLTIHPDDAAERGIHEGDIVVVSNARGRCLAGARISDEMMRGVASLATGAWYAPAEPGKSGTLDLHGNPNVLTTNQPTSTLSYGPAHHSLLVRIALAREVFPMHDLHGAPPPIASDVSEGRA